MSRDLVKKQVEEFILTSKNDLLVLRGRWGIGKTFLWQSLVNEASLFGKFGRGHYAYVSLFGVADLEALKNLILVSRVKSSDAAEVDPGSFSLKRAVKDVEKLPKIRGWTGGLASEVAFLAVRDTLICFDDLERKGNGLDFKDLFGLVSVLKGQRNCKVALILNEDTLSEGDRDGFQRHNEKLVDIDLEFFQTAENAFDTVFVRNAYKREVLSGCCESLKIRNIRILQRLERFMHGVEPLLSKSEESVIKDAISSLVLFVWCYYDKDGLAPPFSYVRGMEINRFVEARRETRGDKGSLSPEVAWNSLLREYGYTYTNDLDILLADYVRQGYFDPHSLKEKLQERNQAAKKSSGRDYAKLAWPLYLDSFDNNEEEFLEALVRGFKDNMEYLTLHELSEVASTLHQFEMGQEADELVDLYLARFAIELSRLKLHPELVFSPRDAYLEEKLGDLLAAVPESRTLGDVVKRVTVSGSWHPDDEAFMAAAGIEGMYAFFKSERSSQLRLCVKRCLDFGQSGNSENGKLLAANAREALLRIASESRINRKRVEALYGVTLHSEASTEKEISSDESPDGGQEDS